MDVHSRQTTFCVLDENGRKLRSKKVRGRWKEVLEELGRVERPFEICYEASTGYGYLYDGLSKMARRVEVAHPGALRLIFRSKRKNDRVDAEKLAKLLYLDEVPPVHVPRGEVRAWRRTIKYRHRMVGERTRAKNAARALLRSQGIEAPKGLWTKRGMEWLKELALTHELDALRRDMLVERIDYLTRGIKRVEKALDRIGRADPRVCLLKTIRGVGMRTAEAVVAWIDRPERFSRNKAVGSYFGLVPAQDESAGKNRLGHITKQGPAFIRQLLVQAAWQGVRRSPLIRAYFERIRRDDADRKKISIVATAHYMLRAMLAMLQTGEVWREEVA